MAEALYICVKTELGGAESFINGVRAIVLNKDDGQTDLQIQTDAAAQASAAFGADGPTFPTLYFDTVTKISDLSSGPLKDNKDSYVLIPGGLVKVKVEG